MNIYINQRIIDYYGENKLIETYYKHNISKLLINRLYRNSQNIDSKITDLSIIDGFEDYLIYLILNNSSKIDKNILIEYRNLLWNLFNNKPEIAYDSKFFHKDIAMRIFTSEQIKKIKEYKVQTSTKYIQELNIIFNKANQSIPNDILRIAEFQIKNGNNRDGNLCDKLYNYLLNNFEANNNIYAKEYILQYTSFLAAKDLNIPMPYVYLATHNLTDKEFNKKTLGESYGNTGIIGINRVLVDNNYTKDSKIPSIISFMHTIAHETRHSSQALNAKNGNISLMSFDWIRFYIFNNYLSKKDYDEYYGNYIHSEIESDANVYGWRYTCLLIRKRVSQSEKYIPILTSNEIETNYLETTSAKQDSTGAKYETWKYNVYKLNEIILKHPKLIQQYPQLKLIYHTDGRQRNIFDLLKIENNNPKLELEKIYSDYYLNFVLTELDNINISELSEDNQFMLFLKICDLIDEECVKLKESMKIYEKYTDNIERRKYEFNHINSERVKRIKKMFNLLNKYRPLTDKLREIDTYRDKNKRVFGFRLNFLNTRLDEIIYYATQKIDLLGVNNSPIADEIRTIKEVNYDGRNQKDRKARK